MNHRHRHNTTRRAFLRQTAATAAGLHITGLAGIGAACNATSESTTEGPGTAAIASGKTVGRLAAKVVSRADVKVFGTHGHDVKRVKSTVYRAVQSLVGVNNPREALRALFDPKDIVAIKLNCLAGPTLSSSVAVVNALVAGLNSIGIKNKHIFIWEQTSAQLTRAGFEINQYMDSKPRCYGVDIGGYEKKLRLSGEVGSLWADVIARRATALINVPVLKDHDLSGVACGMKNMYGAIHNPNRYHDNNCDPYIADVCAHPFVKDKLRLVLTDALTAQCHGGPARVATHQWRPAKILAATDQVAMDRVAQKLIEDQRKIKGMATLKESNRPPKWLKTSAKKGLGEHRLNKIKLDEG